MVRKMLKIYPKPCKFFSLLLLSAAYSFLRCSHALSDPLPTPWPLQFHSVLIINSSHGGLQVTDLWYDWPNGLNFVIFQQQLGKKLYDVQWNNGTCYFYTLDADNMCKIRHLSIGILRPNWLDGANYLGQVHKDGFLCNVWEKVEFLWYYEDVATKRPVFWTFYTGTTTHVITFEIGKVLDVPYRQAPVYCFQEDNKQVDDDDSAPFLESTFDLMMTGHTVPSIYGNIV